jgi:hypothetical protein
MTKVIWAMISTDNQLAFVDFDPFYSATNIFGKLFEESV